MPRGVYCFYKSYSDLWCKSLFCFLFGSTRRTVQRSVNRRNNFSPVIGKIFRQSSECGFVNDVLQKAGLKDFAIEDEGIDEIGRRLPAKGTHGEVIVFSVVNSKLLFEIIE